MEENYQTDVVVVGAGLAGLVAALEAAKKGARVTIVDQEHENSLGGQAFWSLGGLFLVDTPEQRMLGIQDSRDLALQDWLGSANFDRKEDFWPRKWAEAYVDFASGELRSWLVSEGIRFVRIVGWAERGGYLASGHGNSVPRFHIAWGSGPGIVEPFAKKVWSAQKSGRIKLLFRHCVNELLVEGGSAVGVEGKILEEDKIERGFSTTRKTIGHFKIHAQAVILATGGIGGNHDLVRKYWPARMGTAPKHLLAGVPDYVDGKMWGIAEKAGARIINPDRMWHYPEGVHNHSAIWPMHGIRILSGPTPLWLDAFGNRLPSPYFPGFDTLGTFEWINKSGYTHSWFFLNQHILNKEFALSGSEQNPDIVSRSLGGLLRRALPGSTGPVAKFQKKGLDFIVHDDLDEVVTRMNTLVGEELVSLENLERQIHERDRQVDSGLGKDVQIQLIRESRRYLGDKLMRVAKPSSLMNPKHRPLIAVRLSFLTRKTLGGLETDLTGNVLRSDGSRFSGLYAAGEATGFGGGGMHGYRSLEGTFLGGCFLSGKIAGQNAAK